MIDLLRLLSLYYLCDETAARRVLDAAEAEGCVALYESVKQRFSDAPPAPEGRAEQVEQRRAAYRGFKAWEAGNPELVQELRGAARTRLGSPDLS
ncbi:hypothetical protein [Thetidibacter halocola]|uniref:Uncharacterized protein n=1 Tax=Thetidibacter halocola TaxID=2827239 RepID=A0A8J7WGE9_9RHOB|nr:hypothetical protein [Thetidibacter halocola]MBS0124808.1 hypothetical protein [Thetidibacter halocola]